MALPSLIRELDQLAIQTCLVPGLFLMEQASRSLAGLSLRVAGEHFQHGARILVGKGNNGGDGLALARHLLGLGIHVEVLHTLGPAAPDSIGDAELNRSLLGLRWAAPGLRVAPRRLSPELLLGLPPFRGLWVDALLGTGFQGDLRSSMRDIILALNDREERVLAVDVPSGLDAATGCPCPVAVRAQDTGTLGARKTGFQAPGAAQWTGTVHVLEIGWPGPVIARLEGQR